MCIFIAHAWLAKSAQKRHKRLKVCIDVNSKVFMCARRKEKKTKKTTTRVYDRTEWSYNGGTNVEAAFCFDVEQIETVTLGFLLLPSTGDRVDSTPDRGTYKMVPWWYNDKWTEEISRTRPDCMKPSGCSQTLINPSTSPLYFFSRSNKPFIEGTRLYSWSMTLVYVNYLADAQGVIPERSNEKIKKNKSPIAVA